MQRSFKFIRLDTLLLEASVIQKLSRWLCAGFSLSLLLSSCSSVQATPPVPLRRAPGLVAQQSASTNSRSTDLRSAGRIWQDEIIYFIFTDRFANGNRSNDFNVKANDPWAYHGGDLDGIIQKLDYIKDLGATAIWITPVIDNRDNGFVADFGNGHKQEIWGYHGYWFKDFYQVDEHLGDMNKVRQLVQTAHQKGIKVLLDVVVNHVDYDHPFAVDRKNPASKYHKWFNQHGVIKNWDDQWWVENGELAELPDLNQNDPETARYLIDSMKWWAKQSGVDGFRIDTVKHVPRSFWKQFNQEMRQAEGDDFLLLGEIYTPSPEFQAPYQREGMHTAFDFPLYYAIKESFGNGQSMRRLGDIFGKDRVYPNAGLLSPFIDNHDVPRFIHEARDQKKERLMLSMAFLMSIRGMPMLYYGTEVGLAGGADPDNRRDMQFNQDPQLRSYFKRLAQMRHSQRALRRGQQLEMWQDDQVYGFSRMTEVANEEIFSFFNNSSQPQTRRVQVRAESPLKNSSATLVNLFNPQERIQIENGQISITIPPMGFAMYGVAR